MFVILLNGPDGCFTVGPFDSSDAADQWATANLADATWRAVASLQAPADYTAAAS